MIPVLFGFALLQQPSQQPQPLLGQPIARVEVKPSEFVLGIGDTVRLAATAYDSSGHRMDSVPVFWLARSFEGHVDSTGLKYVFVGDEVFPSRQQGGGPGVIGLGRAYGRLHVVDISDLEHPQEVAWYEAPDGGVHDVWVAGDTLYLGDY